MGGKILGPFSRYKFFMPSADIGLFFSSYGVANIVAISAPVLVPAITSK